MKYDIAATRNEGRLGRWVRMLDRRFVTLMEALGYLMCAAIGLGFVASLWHMVDVAVVCEGTIAAPATALSAPADGVVSEWLVEPGQRVRPGDRVCVLDTSKAASARGRARQGLKEALDALESDPANQSVAAQVQTLLNGLAPSSETQTLTAPAAGVWVPSAPASRAELLRQGEVLARIVDTTALELTGTAVGRTGALAVGNPATAVTQWSARPLAGHVSKFDPAGSGKVTIRFEGLPEAVSEAYRNALQASHLEIPEEACKAKVIVGQETLFKSLFGRH